MKEGNIIAIIITVHMPRKVAAAPDHDWPGMRIQAIDRVQPPGISVPGIADMDEHQAIVRTARSGRRVFVMTLPPDAGFIASEWRAI